MTKHEYILENLQEMCEQNNVETHDIICYWLVDKLGLTFFGKSRKDTVEEFKENTKKEHDLLWDLQPTIEEDEEHAFAVQHARDIYNILMGEDLC